MYTNFDKLPITLTVEDVRNVFGIGRKQAYELANSPGFPAIRIGGRICTVKPLLIEWIREQTQVGAGERI